MLNFLNKWKKTIIAIAEAALLATLGVLVVRHIKHIKHVKDEQAINCGLRSSESSYSPEPSYLSQSVEPSQLHKLKETENSAESILNSKKDFNNDPELTTKFYEELNKLKAKGNSLKSILNSKKDFYNNLELFTKFYEELNKLKAKGISAECILNSNYDNDDALDVFCAVIKNYGWKSFKDAYGDNAAEKIMELIKHEKCSGNHNTNIATILGYVGVPLEVIDLEIFENNSTEISNLVGAYKWEGFKNAYGEKAIEKLMELAESVDGYVSPNTYILHYLKLGEVPLEMVDLEIFNGDKNAIDSLMDDYGWRGFQQAYGEGAGEKLMELIKSIECKSNVARRLKKEEVPLKEVDLEIFNGDKDAIEVLIKAYKWKGFKEAYADRAEEKLSKLIKSIPLKNMNYSSMRVYLNFAKVPEGIINTIL